MSKQIDLSKKLTKEERDYLFQYNQHDVLAALDAGEDPQPTISGMTTGTLTGNEPPPPPSIETVDGGDAQKESSNTPEKIPGAKTAATDAKK